MKQFFIILFSLGFGISSNCQTNVELFKALEQIKGLDEKFQNVKLGDSKFDYSFNHNLVGDTIIVIKKNDLKTITYTLPLAKLFPVVFTVGSNEIEHPNRWNRGVDLISNGMIIEEKIIDNTRNNLKTNFMDSLFIGGRNIDDYDIEKLDTLLEKVIWINLSEEKKKLFEKDYKLRKAKMDSAAFILVDEMPIFNGGKSAEETAELLIKYLDKRIAKDKPTEKGIIYVHFIINQNGKVVSPKIMRGNNKNLEQLALKYIKEMPNWTAGKQHNKKVSVQMLIPIKFNQ